MIETPRTAEPGAARFFPKRMTYEGLAAAGIDRRLDYLTIPRRSSASGPRWTGGGSGTDSFETSQSRRDS